MFDRSLVSLRPATSEDLKTVVEIEAKSHPHPWNFQHFEAELEKLQTRFLVLTDDETDQEIWGYFVLWVLDGVGEVLNVTVEPGRRRLGIGNFLIQKMVQLCLQEHCKKMVLEVRKDNTPAFNLYQNSRFDVVRINKKQYQDGCDAYRMELNLEKSEWI